MSSSQESHWRSLQQRALKGRTYLRIGDKDDVVKRGDGWNDWYVLVDIPDDKLEAKLSAIDDMLSYGEAVRASKGRPS